MQNVLKQFGGKATGSFNIRFKQSIRNLTIAYGVTLAIILFLSGAVTYYAFSSRIGHRFERFPPPVIIQTPQQLQLVAAPTAYQVREDLIISLVIVNGFLLVLAGMLSYWLAKVTLRPLKDSYEQQQRFLGDASHELRTPLAILHTELENALADSKMTDSAQERIRSNLEEVQRMTRLVNDLLVLSHIDEQDSNEVAVNKMIEINSFINEIADRVRPLARSHNVAVSVTELTATDTNIVTNEDLLSHAITNIMQNAIVYNKNGGTVTVSLSRSGKFIEIRVVDTGIGIAAADLKNIFNRFYRSDTSRSRQSGGSGLGLSIARASIGRIGGFITIDSVVGTGTTVTLRIPKN